MSVEEFKKIDATKLPIGKLIAIISKNQTLYLNRHLEDFNINASQLHFLFEISHQKEINQEQIASRCNIDKGAVARSIRKLEENGLVKRQIDNNNRRQNIISLTSKGEETLKKAIKQLDDWEEYVFNDNLIKKEDLQKSLKKIAIKSIEVNEGE
nr:MarR family transcriptional regulator [uncultured Methanobrevibacter sp.]